MDLGFRFVSQQRLIVFLALGQFLITAVSDQRLAALAEGGGGLLAGLLGVAQRPFLTAGLVVGLGQQPCQGGIVQFGMRPAPLGQFAIQNAALLA